MKRQIFVFLLLLGLVVPVSAQDAVVPETVVIAAGDGLEIQGDYYASSGGQAVLLLHMLGGRRADWDSLIPYLTTEGYTVLAVDMRGHGETRGSQEWALAEQDVQTLLDWLREQGAEEIALVGASIGSNLALRGMANDEAVVTAIALSPGLDYRGVTTEDAIEAIGRRPVLLVAERVDRYSADSVAQLFALATGLVQVRIGTSAAHGTNMLGGTESLEKVIAAWLAEHFSVGDAE